MPFAALGLIPELVRALSDRGYVEPTPIQGRVIPEILAGRDILAGAQTGTGKTAGFTLPLLQRLKEDRRAEGPRALVLVPTRELAAQVHESVRSYGKYLPLRAHAVFGGVSINPQIDALRRGVDVLVATPGRLLDLAQQGAVELSDVRILVLDEADRMLDMGFIADIRRILKLLPAQRQNLLFSATYTEEIRRLAQALLRNPVEIEVARRNAAVESVEQRAYFVAKDQKRSLLSHLILDGDWSQVLVFTRTKHGANRLTKQLAQDGIEAAAIHGNKSQSARTQALAGFKAYRVRALVATEVASRGLDIRELPYVVNYELPNVPEDYVHRIGRTGRAGATGLAISLIAPDESELLKSIERVLRKPIPRAETPAFAPRTDRPPSTGEHHVADRAQAHRRTHAPHSHSRTERAPRSAARSDQRSAPTRTAPSRGAQHGMRSGAQQTSRPHTPGSQGRGRGASAPASAGSQDRRTGPRRSRKSRRGTGRRS